MTATVAITHQNHYVPIWYQKGFIASPRNTLYYLDLDPPRHTLADGRVVVERNLWARAPKGCFWAEDLYTTRFGETINDEVERFLFGGIDNDGANAVRAFASNDLGTMHRLFQRFFEYMNAQKLRTPKGLDWIKSVYPRLSQLDLMVEMQHLRQMHCTMWYECVREIVSAEKSDVKFIVSDHPVTAYNPALPPSSPACAYPEDPSIALNGTQTLFALDADHCLILTNLEYAKDPGGVDVLARRQNARFFGQTIARTDAMIRTRFLSREEVVSINHVLKARVRRYIAAYEKDWLYPGATTWESVAKILLPRDELYRFGGEIYVGYQDGSTHYQDAFGRTSSAHDFLKKDERSNLRPNDLCGCESGRRFKKCCGGIEPGDRPLWNVFSIRERNLALCRAVVDILGLNKGKTWEDVRRELSDEQVKRTHEFVAALWPADTSIADLLPRPDRRILRAVYLGFTDPRTVAQSVTSWLAYFDEIVIVHPFPNPSYLKPEFSPTHVPAQHKSQFLKNVSLLLSLAPLIDAGLIHMVPDPMEFNAAFRQHSMAIGQSRRADIKLEKSDQDLAMALGKDELRRALARLPEDQQRRIVRRARPSITPDLLDRTIRYMKDDWRDDPLALLQPAVPGEAGAQLQILKGINLELAMFVAHLTGSIIYTDSPTQWNQLLRHAKRQNDSDGTSPWLSVVHAIQDISLVTELNPEINLELRRAGSLGHIRRVLRQTCNAVLTAQGDVARQVSAELARRLRTAAIRAEGEWHGCTTTIVPSLRVRRRMKLSVPTAGFELTTAHRLLVAFGRTSNLGSVSIGVFVDPAPVQT